jgi:signal transduction histidine kinase
MSLDSELLPRAEASLAEAHRRTEAIAFFARRVSHDLSNFLTVIRTYSELVLADTPETSPAKADLEEIRQAADTIVAYLQRASAFGRATSSPLAPTLLDGFVAAVVAQANAGGRGPIVLHAASDARVTASAAGLADALQELIANAREASPRDAEVVVHTSTRVLTAPLIDGGVPIAAGRWAVVSVRDDGPGVEETVRETAFDPFVSTKAGVRGAGLGLAIARAAIWAANGQLTIVREAPHTIARVYLPASAPT